ncbi:DUF4388 domain-containing protein [Pedosphaera parvula]|nr:DUF4388 domain-containing protein [Pedosphaera parvula]
MKKKKFVHQPDSEQLLELRRREEEIAAKPSAECYLKLADDYQNLGLNKESDRLLQLAESLEGGDRAHGHDHSKGLMSGAANPVMIAEVIQILSRTTLTGDLSIDAKTETFHLYFDKGQIINASSEHYPPALKSFCMALRVTSGTYRFAERPVDKIERLIEGNTEVLLLNAMYDKDQELSQKSGT